MRRKSVLCFTVVVLSSPYYCHAACANSALISYNTTNSGACPSTGSWMMLYHLITLGDLIDVDTVDGRTFVGGDLYATDYFATQSEFGMDQKEARLEVAGSVKGGSTITISNGSVKVGSGTISPANPSAGQKSYYVDGRYFWLSEAWSGATLKQETGLKNKAALIKYDVTNWSNQLKNLPTNNAYTKPSGGFLASTAFVIDAKTVDANGVAVFNIVQGDLFGNTKVGSIDIRNSINAKAIVINVQGTYINWKNGYMTGSGILFQDGQSKILWNFYEAATIFLDMQFYNFVGSVLAPFADVTSKSDIKGSVVVNSLTSTSDVDYPTHSIGCQDASTGLTGVAALVKALV